MKRGPWKLVLPDLEATAEAVDTVGVVAVVEVVAGVVDMVVEADAAEAAMAVFAALTGRGPEVEVVAGVAVAAIDP